MHLVQAPAQPKQPPATPTKEVTVWQDVATGPTFPRLASYMVADCVIVGGGFAGLTTAYQLLKQGERLHCTKTQRTSQGSATRCARVYAGRSVVLLEAGKISGGQSGRSTAHLMTWADDGYNKLMNQFGRRQIRLVAKSHRDAINFVRQVSTCPAAELWTPHVEWP